MLLKGLTIWRVLQGLSGDWVYCPYFQYPSFDVYRLTSVVSHFQGLCTKTMHIQCCFVVLPNERKVTVPRGFSDHGDHVRSRGIAAIVDATKIFARESQTIQSGEAGGRSRYNPSK